MARSSSALALCCLLFWLGSVAACARRGGEQATSEPAADAELGWLRDAKRRLDAERAELARVAKLQKPGTEEIERRRRDVERLAREFNRRLVGYINADPALEGEPLAEHQLAAVRMKSDEDILIARQHIEQAGDYRTAIEIYRAALALDPANPRLEDELRRAEASRFMTAERFGRLQVGMTEAEVREAVGTPNPNNVRNLADRAIVGWFYPKDARGAAAGVWLRPAEDGAGLVVYELDFDAVAPPADTIEQPAPPAPST